MVVPCAAGVGSHGFLSQTERALASYSASGKVFSNLWKGKAKTKHRLSKYLFLVLPNERKPYLLSHEIDSSVFLK